MASHDTAAAAATAKAAPSPATAEPVQLFQRRSDRVLVSFKVFLSGIDATGADFQEECRTQYVSRHGASILSYRVLAPELRLTLRRSAGTEAHVRVVGQMGLSESGHSYGVELLDSNLNFWGITFPPPNPEEPSAGRALLRCCSCHAQEIVAMNEVELSVYEAGQQLSRPCPSCSNPTVWQPVPNDPAPPTTSKAGQSPRKHPRTKMHVMACVQVPGEDPDPVPVQDLSRGGVCFVSSRNYLVQSWIQIAVPYMPGVGNIFVPAKIAWQRKLTERLHQYGAQYLRT